MSELDEFDGVRPQVFDLDQPVEISWTFYLSFIESTCWKKFDILFFILIVFWMKLYK